MWSSSGDGIHDITTPRALFNETLLGSRSDVASAAIRVRVSLLTTAEALMPLIDSNLKIK